MNTNWLDWVLTEARRVEGESGELMEKYAPQFARLAEEVVAALKDGFQFGDIRIFGSIVPQIMEIAKNIEGASGAAKRQFVVDAVWLIYHSADTGPDGKANRIRLPVSGWLSSFGMKIAEEKIERLLLRVATEFAIEAVYRAVFKA